MDNLVSGNKARMIFLSGGFSALIMLSLSLFWHGVALNDLSYIEFPLPMFVLMASLVYFAIGVCLASVMLNVAYKGDNLLFKQFSTGALLGLVLYLMAFVLGISFKTQTFHIVLDFLWQMTEQGVGALAVVLYAFVARIMENNAEQQKA